ncbi:MAG: hypothetical protein JO215_11870, partial [Ktedonobacteraceae bacterium]|nr:hypothetical protein [Ktedonobacteraceae bacterium]
MRIQEAARHFGEQYQRVPWIEARGQVQLEQGERCVMREWQTVGMLDLELGLLGLGTPGDDEEALC